MLLFLNLFSPLYKNSNNNIIMNEPNNNNVIQGGSLKTWSYFSSNINKVKVTLESFGRPIDSDIELWNGPSNSPYKFRVYSENGFIRPFSTILEIPFVENTIAIKNIAQIELPLKAYINTNNLEQYNFKKFDNIQGGAIRTYKFDSNTDSIQIFIKTDGRPINSRIELLQGPTNNKQVIELYSEDGYYRPFWGILQTPGSGNIVQIINTSPIEFPISASIIPNKYY